MNDAPEGTARQRRLVLAALRSARPGPISVHDAIFEAGVTRTAARVFELRRAGFVIETIRGRKLPDGRQELARYRLVSEPDHRPIDSG